LQQAPDHYPALELQARLYLQNGEAALARRELQALLKRFPERARALYQLLGDLELEAGRWAEALRCYRESSRREDDLEVKRKQEIWLQELALFPEFEVLQGQPAERGKSPVSEARRFEAVGRISRVATSLGLENLIGLLDDENLRLARQAWQALRRLTRQELAFSKEAWSSWWNKEGRQAFLRE